MENRKEKSPLDPKESVAKNLKRFLITTLVFSLIAAAIYVIGTFVWWIGLILFVAYALIILARLVRIGFALAIETAIFGALFSIIKRGLSPLKFDKVHQLGGSVLVITVVWILVEIYLLLITFLLGSSFASSHV